MQYLIKSISFVSFLYKFGSLELDSPVVQVANEIVDVVNVHPAVDVYGTCHYGNQQHERQLDDMAELYEHHGCHERQH